MLVTPAAAENEQSDVVMLARATDQAVHVGHQSVEPASVLLTRIRAEREAKSASVKSVKRARKVLAQRRLV